MEAAPGTTARRPTAGRAELAKAFHGGLEGTSRGVTLSAGDPASGAEGCVAIEFVSGALAGQWGGFALVQLGSMLAGGQELRYEVVPGSGSGELAGLTGSVQLTVDDDGTHHYALSDDLR